MSRVKAIIIVFIVVGLAGTVLGLFLSSDRTDGRKAPEPVASSQSSSGLGISYLPVTQGLAEYYVLGITRGNLVTEVAQGSPADLAGLQPGDVILSFNDARPDEPTPLLGMMMSCRAGHTVTMEVWRQEHIETIQLFHR